MQTKIRKYQNILVCAGEGTILFGLWGFFRVILMFTLGEEKKMLKEAMATFSSQERMISWIAVSAVILVIGGIMVWLHLYIGLSAIREGHGTGKRKRGFLRLAAFLVVLDFLSVSSLSYLC
ncbi:MAG: hypothetical protein IJT32_05115 [Lachnospiraceae bacterium]|nr:hypothetical protein [Lachnospiraceae bacterium]